MNLLRLACIDSEVPPLFQRSRDGVTRGGFEPAVAAEAAREIGARLEWLMMPWSEMIPAVQSHRAEAVWCGQGIIPSRQAQVDFTRPYAIFHESVLVRKGTAVHDPSRLEGMRVAAIADSANEALARTFAGITIVPFSGDTDDVFGDMLVALERDDVGAVVDDDVAFLGLQSDDRFEIAFTVETGNRWGVGVAKDRRHLRDEIDQALGAIIADSRLASIWREWMPALPYPATLLSGTSGDHESVTGEDGSGPHPSSPD